MSIKNRFFLGQKGQLLLEMVVALAIILLVLLALVRLVIGAVRSSDFAKRKAQAASYAQEGMENMRSLRDKNWISFKAYTVGSPTWGLAAQIPSGSCPTDPNLGTFFIRCVKLEYDTVTNRAKATLTVSWTDSNGIHKSQLISYFTDWQ